MIRIDTAELRDLAKDLSKTAPDAKAGMRAGLRAAGEVVAAAAREHASWSNRIPGTVRVTVRQHYAIVSAGGPKAPHAVALEHEGRPGKFRHPTNAWARKDRAEWKWGEQQARPFLHPALVESADLAAKVLVDSLVDAGLLKGMK